VFCRCPFHRLPRAGSRSNQVNRRNEIHTFIPKSNFKLKMSKGGRVYRACEWTRAATRATSSINAKGFEMNFHQATAGARCHARAMLLRAFVPDIGEKLGFPRCEGCKSLFWKWWRSGAVAEATLMFEENKASVVSGTARGSFYINFGNLSQERS